MELYFIALLIITKVFITFSTRYELEFLDMEIYSAFENYPNNSMDSGVDMSNLKIEQTEEGSLNAQGYVILKKSVDGPVPVSVELYKRVRGTWQPTIYSQKRVDTCTAIFSKLELWHSYLKSIPEEQLTCPFREGQRLDVNISEPTYINIPDSNLEGYYKVHGESGHPNSNFFVCVEIFVTMHKA